MIKQISLVALAFCLFACEKKPTDEEVITQKAEARWAIRIAGKSYGLYDYLSPAQKQIYDREPYERSIGQAVTYKDAKVASIDCNEEKTTCQVKVLVSYQFGKMENSRALDEVWIKQDDDWWFSEK